MVSMPCIVSIISRHMKKSSLWCLPKLHGTEASSVGDMLQLQLLELFALGVKIDSTYFSLDLVEADVIEAFKGSSDYCSHSVVWN